MKKILLIAGILLSGAVVYAQTPQKGPVAKNYKAWKSIKAYNPNALMVKTKVEKQSGLVAKNQNPWGRRSEGDLVSIDLVANKTKRKGLKSKNRNPWR